MSDHVTIRPVRREDSATWKEMRQLLWPSEPDEHSREIGNFFGEHPSNPEEVLLAFSQSGNAVGFIELSIRSYAEGCQTARVAYIEGWFVAPSARRSGVGSALVRAAEAWGRVQGCTEIASDADIENIPSISAHKALGFAEVGRSVCFRKNL